MITNLPASLRGRVIKENVDMDELISRKAAIDALADYIHNIDRVYSTGKLSADDCREAAQSVLDDLPSAQPDIIRCKGCKHFIREDIEEYTPYGFYNTYFRAFCDKHWDREQGEYIDVKLDDFCSFAERR